MKKHVLILGSTGMLGSMLLDVLSQESEFILYTTVRQHNALAQLRKKYPKVTFFLFDADKDKFGNLLTKTKKIDWIINAIGIIKPFIHEENSEEVRRAISINSVFPFEVAKETYKKGIKIIQIATDCVYSGEKGNYVETSKHDALDVYGKTKSLGEVPSENFYNLRCSIIGPEEGTQKSLLEWFRSQKKGAQLSGFTNHSWNGITTLHFAKLSIGIIKSNTKLNNVQHIVPGNLVTKAELLHIFAKYFDRKDIKITKIRAKEKIKRTLATIHDTINKSLWRQINYKNPPTIEQMVEELAGYMRVRTQPSSRPSPKRRRRSRKGDLH